MRLLSDIESKVLPHHEKPCATPSEGLHPAPSGATHNASFWQVAHPPELGGALTSYVIKGFNVVRGWTKGCPQPTRVTRGVPPRCRRIGRKYW